MNIFNLLSQWGSDPAKRQGGLLNSFSNQLTPAQRSALFGNTQGGAATINPSMYLRGPQVAGLLGYLMAKNPNAPISDSEAPRRNAMDVPAQPFGNTGVHSNPFPGARLPNAYRGPLTPQGVPGVPDAPEYYVPGFEKTWLRGT